MHPLNFVSLGKVFYIELDGEGRIPVLHFGMTGNVLVSSESDRIDFQFMLGWIKVKGQVPLYYKEGPRKGDGEWPPRFTKVSLRGDYCHNFQT